MRVCVVAEYYPRRRDLVLGVWAHRQALAARDAGAEVRVLVLERPVPPVSALRSARRLGQAVAAQRLGRGAGGLLAEALEGVELIIVDAGLLVAHRTHWRKL